MFLRLPPPQEIADQSARDIDAVEQVYRGRKANIGKTKRKRLDRVVRNLYDRCSENTAALRSNLARLNEFYDGKEEAVDWPFGSDASSSIDIRLAAAYGRILRASFVEAVWSDPRVYVAVPVPGVSREEANKIEAAVNWVAQYESNLNETLKDSVIPIYRDSTALLHGQWVRRVEHGCDFRQYFDGDAFRADYPTPESAGMDDENYDEVLAILAEPDAEVRVEYQMDFLSYNGPEFTLFPLAKFVWGPLYEQNIAKLKLYGFRFDESSDAFEINAKYGFYDTEAANECRSRAGDSGSDEWDASRESMDGISSGNDGRSRYKLAWLVVTEDLDGDNIPEKYVVVWDTVKRRSLRVENYGVRRNIPCIIPYRFIRKDGRLIGAGLLMDGEHLFREVNALHRHRSNTRRLSDSITLLFPEGLKDRVDLGAEYNQFIPGRPLYVPDQYMDPKFAPRQLDVHDPSRTQSSTDEEMLIQRYLDLVLGTTQGQSGRESPMDPNAPGNKTAMLLRRADLRVEDFIDEWRRSIPETLDLLRALYYQNAGRELPIMTNRDGQPTEAKIPVASFADPNVKCALRQIKPSLSPESEMSKIAALAAGAMKMPMVLQAKPQVLIELWNDYVAASRIDRPERYQIQMPQGAGAPPMMGGTGGSPVGPDMLAGLMQQMGAGAPPAEAAASTATNGGTT